MNPASRTLGLAAVIGNALEWYEILIYGYFSLQISRAFFPGGDEVSALLLTLGGFSLSFFSRPLGALVLGSYADRVGRTASLRLSITLMMLGTAAVTFMPTFQQIGWLAPLGVMLARLCQGFSAGGEFGSATALIIETSSAERRGYAGSLQFASQGVSTLSAAIIGLALTSLLSPEQLQEWGWRLALGLGLLIGPVGFYLRRSNDGPGSSAPRPIRPNWYVIVTKHRWTTVLAIGCLAVSTAVNYTLVYFPTYAVRDLGATQALGFACALVASVIQIVVTPLAGYASDTLGRVPMMWVSALVLTGSFFPAFLLLSQYTAVIPLTLAIVAWLALWKSIYIAPYSALIAVQFPYFERATGLALSYNVGVALFGGSSPVAMAWLTQISGSKIAPSAYLTAVGAISVVALSALRAKSREQPR